jgi:hypothetical protein
VSELPPEEEAVEPEFSVGPVAYNPNADTWSLTYPGGEGFGHTTLLDPLPAGDFTVVCTVNLLPEDPQAGVGLVLMAPEAPLSYFLASREGTTVSGASTASVEAGVPVHLKIEYVGDEASFWHSTDGVAWWLVTGGLLQRPTQVGLVLRYAPALTPVTASASSFRVLEGLLADEPLVVQSLAPIPPPPPAPILLATSAEPIVNVVVGAQFGDLEFDVGKSVRWLMWFGDRHYIVDVNTGTQRYWVVNWALTFPEALSSITPTNFFVRPVDFRKESFARADKAWGFGDEDWVLFCDAHEGLSVDNRTLPDDWATEPFKSYSYREIARAEAASQDRSVLPFFVFTEHTDIENITYPIGEPTEDNPFTATQPIAVPYYIPNQGLTRLIKVSALRNPGFDWTRLDQPSTPDAGCKIQIISHAYAHWNLQDIVPPATEPEPLTAANDDGWRMRQLISRVRPVTGLPFTDPWKPPDQDTEGLPGPTSFDANQFGADVLTVRIEPREAPATRTADPLCEGITTPLYDTVFRINLRDGVWYESGQLGNLPLQWNETTQAWEPAFPVESWTPDNFAIPVP